MLEQAIPTTKHLKSGDWQAHDANRDAIRSQVLEGSGPASGHPRHGLRSFSAEQLDWLESDLDLAGRIQSALLPQRDLRFGGWQVHYDYAPAGPVGGDYCDLITRDSGVDTLYPLFGDIAGKGVAASLLMANLHALVRCLVDSEPSLCEIVGRVNRMFSGVTLPSQYATLVSARATPDGCIEVCNAGHTKPLLLSRGEVVPIECTGFPVGMFEDSEYSLRRIHLSSGDSLVFYTDGLTEAQNSTGSEYGVDRLTRVLGKNSALPPDQLSTECRKDVTPLSSGPISGR